jgi:hypothetical protein
MIRPLISLLFPVPFPEWVTSAGPYWSTFAKRPRAFGELGIDDAALLGRIVVVRSRELEMDADDAAGDLEFDFLAAPKTGLPTHGRRDHKRRFVFDGDGHERLYVRNLMSLSV